MRLQDGFITYDTDGEQIMVAAGNTSFSGLARSNETAAFIIDCLKQETTPEEIAQKLFATYDAPMETIRTDVNRILEILRGIGAIRE